MKLLFSSLGMLLVGSTAFSSEVSISCKVKYFSQRNSYVKVENHILANSEVKPITFGTYTLVLKAGEDSQLATSGEDFIPVNISIWSPKYNIYVSSENLVHSDELVSVNFSDTQTKETLIASCKVQ